MFQNVNRIFEKITQKIENAIDKSLDKDKKVIDSNKRDIITEFNSNKTNSYQKLVELYKNKYSGNLIKRVIKRDDKKDKKIKNSLETFNDRYAKAGAEYSNDLKELALELLNAIVKTWDNTEN